MKTNNVLQIALIHILLTNLQENVSNNVQQHLPSMDTSQLDYVWVSVYLDIMLIILLGCVRVRVLMELMPIHQPWNVYGPVQPNH